MTDPLAFTCRECGRHIISIGNQWLPEASDIMLAAALSQARAEGERAMREQIIEVIRFFDYDAAGGDIADGLLRSLPRVMGLLD